MSSILDALKKLEKEKLHRDEISTAIASDILRSGKKKKAAAWRIPLSLFLLVIFASSLALFLFYKDASVAIDRQTPDPVPALRAPVMPPQAEVHNILEPAPASRDLPILSGIVYQQQPEARMAILNDLPVMEGTVIAGYTLQEIFSDHVVLVRHKQATPVFLSDKN